MASTWWDKNGPMKPLHQMNPLRVDYINQHHAVANQRILDVGCGGGILTEALAKKGASVTGIDMSQKAIHAAKEHAQQEKIDLTYLQSSIEAFTKPNQNHLISSLAWKWWNTYPTTPACLRPAKVFSSPMGVCLFRLLTELLKRIYLQSLELNTF